MCQNKKHEFDQYTKGGHFCAAHMALKGLNVKSLVSELVKRENDTFNKNIIRIDKYDFSRKNTILVVGHLINVKLLVSFETNSLPLCQK